VSKSIELSRISSSLVKISQGGQGIVYKAPQVSIPFAKSMVYKEYKPAALATLNVAALKAMPAFLESLPYGEGARLISIAAWPCRVVEDNGKTTGFVMPAIPDEFFTEFWTVKGPSRVAAEFQHLLNEPQVLARSFGGQLITDRQRYGLLRSLVSALAFLHDHRICVGDLSPKNLLFSLSGNPEIFFIDCDAMRVNGVSLTTQLETPGWEIPAGEEKATTFSDRYKLGLLALRLIVGSQDGKDPAQLPASIHPDLRKVITDTLTLPAPNRPTLSTWESALEKAWQAAPSQPPRLPSPPPVAPVTARPSTSPVPTVQPQVSRPVLAQVQTPRAPSSNSPKPLKILAWLAVPALLLAVVLTAAFRSDSSSRETKNAARGNTPGSTVTTPSWGSTSTIPARPSATPTAPVNVIPPPEAPGLDPNGQSCSGGYQLNDGSGWATRAIRGTARTSCQFTYNILVAYQRNFAEPSKERRIMEVEGSVRCDSVAGAECAPGGRLFLVTCAAPANQDWITCWGGVGAEVYLY
jgi:serine/threonine protein kinase